MGSENTSSAPVSRTLLTLAAVVIIFAGIKAATSIVIPILLAGFIAILCGPLLSWLGRHGVSKAISLFAIIGGVIIGGLLLVSILGSSIRDFNDDLAANSEVLQQQQQQLMDRLQNLGVDTSALESYNLFDGGAVMRYTARALNSLSAALTNGFLILMIVVFMLMEASSMPAKLKIVAGSHPEALEGLDAFLKSVNRYMAIKTMTSLGTGLLVLLMLTVLKVKFAILWGLLAFLLNYIPNIGSILASLPAILLALIDQGAMTAVGTALGYVVVNVVVGNIIEPRIMGEGLGLSTLVVFLSLVFWGFILGPVGMLLSVPLTVMVKIALDTSAETRWLSVLLGR
jgi:predicted PurR-regulated permease PerM